jgi:hypothetical protein
MILNESTNKGHEHQQGDILTISSVLMGHSWQGYNVDRKLILARFNKLRNNGFRYCALFYVSNNTCSEETEMKVNETFFSKYTEFMFIGETIKHPTWKSKNSSFKWQDIFCEWYND